ncbi:MAG TPA: VOC family protein, partial [Candidatus Binatia bacterium]|nr:VOC family protein [Candidatus Binatia bacterium]
MMRLRQVALVAHDLAAAVADIRRAFDLGEPFHDPGVEVFGLHNAVLSIGDTFLEVVSPLRDDCSGARYLRRRGGDGGYMVIVQTDDLATARQRIAATSTRVVFELVLEDIATMHLHPRDTGGALLSIDAAVQPAEWRWAGAGWRARSRTARCVAIAGVEIQCDDPSAVAARWSRLLDRPATPISNGGLEIGLDDSVLRFVALRDGRGEGLHTVLLRRTAGTAGSEIELCGT